MGYSCLDCMIRYEHIDCTCNNNKEYKSNKNIFDEK